MNLKYINMFCAGLCFSAGIFSLVFGNILPAIACFLAMTMNLAWVRWL